MSFSCVIALTVSLLLARTETVFGHGSFHERMDYLIEELAKTPSDPVLRFELAGLLAQHGDTQLALQSLDKVDALVP